MIAGVETIIAVTKASIALHNYLITEIGYRHIPENLNEIIPNKEIRGLWTIPRQGSKNSGNIAKDIRDRFKEYFNSDVGAVPWQYDMFNINKNFFYIYVICYVKIVFVKKIVKIKK